MQTLSAQRWESANNGLQGGVVRSLVVSNNVVFASLESAGVFRSRDNGATWESVNAALPHNILFVSLLSAVEYGGQSFMFAATNRGLYRSSDGGTTWQNCSTGLPSKADPRIQANVPQYSVGSVFGSERALGAALVFCTYSGGVYRSSDGGVTWQTSNTGLPLVPLPDGSRSVVPTVNCASLGDTVVLGTQEGIFFSTDAARSWSAMNEGLEYYNEQTRTMQPERNVYTISRAMNGTILLMMFGNTNQYRWDNGKKRWQHLSQRIFVSDYGALGGRVFIAGFASGMYRSLDNGVTMVAVNTGLEPEKTGGVVYSVAANEQTQTIFAGAMNGVFRSMDGGESWEFANLGLHGLNIRDVLVDAPRNIMLATGGNDSRSRIFRSIDGGNSWKAVFAEQLFLRQDGATVGIGAIKAFVRHGNSYFAGAGGLIRSDDNGATWQFANQNFYVGVFQTPNVDALCSRGSVLLAGTLPAGIMRSLDNGVSWEIVTRGMNVSSFNWVTHLAQTNRFVFALRHASSTNGIVYRSSDDGASWELLGGVATGDYVGGLTANSDTVWIASQQQGVVRSTDNGLTWKQVNNGLPQGFTPVARTHSLQSVGGVLYLCTMSPNGEQLFRSQNGGDTWERFDTGVANVGYASAIAGDRNTIVLGATSGMYRLQTSTTSVRENAATSLAVEAPMRVLPNPIQGQGALFYTVPKAARVRIVLVNALGQQIRCLQDMTRDAGNHTLSFGTDDIPAGAYSLFLDAGAERQSVGMLVVR